MNPVYAWIKTNRVNVFVLLALTALCIPPVATAATITIGSKTFTESVILGEVLSQLARQQGHEVNYHRELGGTRVLWSALVAGEIDAYVEYTGTLSQEILEIPATSDTATMAQALSAYQLRMTAPLGFNNTYALGLPRDLANQLAIRRISDLVNHPQLVMGFSNEFMDRADGWPGLRAAYTLPQQNVRGLNHDLAYRGLSSGDIQVTDLYTTDAEIEYYQLQTINDDRRYFPAYQALVLYRADLTGRAPRLAHGFEQLAGMIDENAMIRMNGAVKLHGESEASVAGRFLQRHFGITTTHHDDTLWQRLWHHTLEHLTLVCLSLGAAIIVALPLGIAAARLPRFGRLIIGATGLLQTIPSLALFVFLIPLLGIGGPPAVAALFLYSLLPIVRNTHAGLTNIAPAYLESATVLGLTPAHQLWRVELPLALRTIVAGIQTAAVINVGTATLAALIGAGGYGQPILTGIRLDNPGLIMEGAIPAAAMALLAQGLFELLEHILVPRGLK